MKTYQKLILFVAIVAAAVFAYTEFAPKPKICQNVYSAHAYSGWKSTGQISQAFIGDAHVLMQRKCFRCGHIDAKASD